MKKAAQGKGGFCPPFLGAQPRGGMQGMLYLTRKIGESVIINDGIEVTVIEVRGKSVKLGFEFPASATVLRKEIYERIQAENRAAAEGGAALLDTPPAKDI